MAVPKGQRALYENAALEDLKTAKKLIDKVNQYFPQHRVPVKTLNAMIKTFQIKVDKHD